MKYRNVTMGFYGALPKFELMLRMMPTTPRAASLRHRDDEASSFVSNYISMNYVNSLIKKENSDVMSALISAAGRTTAATVAKATSAASVAESASGRSATAAIAEAASSATETASSSSTSGLGAKNGRFAASGAAATRLGLEHRRVFQHVRKNEESDEEEKPANL